MPDIDGFDPSLQDLDEDPVDEWREPLPNP
jgi:hypothetical protein